MTNCGHSYGVSRDPGETLRVEVRRDTVRTEARHRLKKVPRNDILLGFVISKHTQRSPIEQLDIHS